MTHLVRHRRVRRQIWRGGWITAIPLFLALVWVPVGADARGAPESFADIVEGLLPAVVNISTTQKLKANRRPRSEEGPAFEFPPGSPFGDFFDQFNRRGGDHPKRRATSLGSGFLISDEGHVVTNNHVIEGADEILIEFFSGEELPATFHIKSLNRPLEGQTQRQIALCKIWRFRKSACWRLGHCDWESVGAGGYCDGGDCFGAWSRHPFGPV